MAPEGDRPWDRLPGEGPRAHAAFLVYRDLGPGTRSLAKAARTLGKSRALLERWSADWDWVARCQAFDDALQRRKLQQQLKHIQEMTERQVTHMLLVQQNWRR